MRTVILASGILIAKAVRPDVFTQDGLAHTVSWLVVAVMALDIASFIKEMTRK